MHTFPTQALILWHQKVVSQFYQPISIKLYIEIDDVTFQFLNHDIGQKYLKNAIQLFCKLTYSFVAIDF